MDDLTGKALREIVGSVTELAEIVRDLDHGRVRQYDLIADRLHSARAAIRGRLIEVVRNEQLQKGHGQ